MSSETREPISIKRLEQIATDVCTSVMTGVEYYDHPKTEQWNATIIDKMLIATISEATPADAKQPQHKFVVTSTIVQHVVPTIQMNKAAGGTDVKTEGEKPKKGPAGRRGMHTATGAYWNAETDGMWSYKFDGGERGLDIVMLLVWITF